MKTALKFKKFNRDKSVDELFYNSSIMTANIEFIKTDLDFMRKLIKSYPFSNNISNLFERIQLYIKEIDLLEKENNDILKNVQKHKTQLNGMLECNDLSCDNFYVIEHEKIAAMTFNYVEKYRKFKTNIIEYVNGIIY